MSTWTFVRNFITRFHHTGAVLPSSAALARAMTKPLTGRPQRPVSVLEVGAGTGVFTREILRKLQPGDVFNIYEINPEFCAVLERETLAGCGPEAGADGPALQLVQADVRDEAGRGLQYDYIVSGLPFNNFAPRFVEEVLSLYLRLLKPGGTLSFFEYMHVRDVKLRLPLTWEEHQRIDRIDGLIRGLAERFEQEQIAVWPNVLPAFARIWQRSPVRP